MANTNQIFWTNGISTTATFTGYPGGDKSDMTTKVYELAAGFVGVVSTRIDGQDIPVADTRPYKTYAKAERAASKLALDIVKNGVSL